jgi:hypothetical protein
MSTNKFTTNNNPTLVAVSNADGETPVYLYADPATHGLVVSATISSVGLATSANQTNGSQLTQIVDAGGEAATVTGGKLDVNATATLSGSSIPISGAATGVGVAILDGSGNQVTSFGGGTQYDEDTASADGQKLTMAGVTRADTAASQVGTDGDRSTLIVDASGRMHVNVGTSALPTGASTSAKQDTGNTSLASIDGKITAVNTGAVVVSSSALPSGASTSAKQDTQITAEQAIQASVELIDDTVATLGTTTYTEATTKGITIGAVRRDANTTLVDTTNEVAPLQVNATGELKVAQIQALPAGANAIGKLAANDGVDIGDVTINNASGGSAVNIQDGGNSITVDGAVTTSGTVTEANSGAALTSLQLIDDIVYTDDTSTHATGTSKGAGIMAVAAPTDASVDANDIGMVAMTTARALKNDLTTIAGTAAVNGSGTATGALRVELPTNGTGVIATVGAVTAITNALPTGTNSIGDVRSITTSIVPGTGATNLGKAEDAQHTTGDVGVAILGIRDDTLNATSGTEGDYEMFHTTAEGAMWVTQAPSITNGWATFNATSGDGSTALTNTAQQVKATTGTVGGWYIYNPNATATYVNFYNDTSASVTVGTTNQQMVICVPATAGANVEFGNGITFATAISISATTTGGGNTAPGSALECNVFYK